MPWWGWMVVALAVLWVLFNWAAPFAILLRSERVSPGRLPRELFTSDEARRARFYVADLPRPGAFSIWAPPLHVVVFDRSFFRYATAAQVRFVVAHELAHFTMGHHWRRWVLVVLGVALLPQVRRWLAHTEEAADEEAERRTGLPRSILKKPKGEVDVHIRDIAGVSAHNLSSVYDGVLHPSDAGHRAPPISVGGRRAGRGLLQQPGFTGVSS